MTTNFFDDPEAIEASRDPDIPPSLLGNPLFDDEPTPVDPPPEPPRQAAPPPPVEETESEPQAPPQAPQGPPQVSIDPNTLAQSIAYAIQRSQPRPQARPEDYDPPELDIDESVLEDPVKLKAAMRKLQVETARHTRDTVYREMAPHLQAFQAQSQYLQSRMPVDEWNARQAARQHLVRQGLAQESEVDQLLDRAAPAIAQSMEHRLNPNGWVAAAQYALVQSGSVPAREKPKAAPGAGRGDATPPKRSAQPEVAKNPYLKTVEKLNGRPMNPQRLQDTWEKRHAGR